MKNITTRTSLKVEFYDLDPMNIVWHGNYIKYLETARCDFFEKLNYNYMDMYNDGVTYPVVKMDLKFIKPAKFGDTLTVECSLKELEPAIIIKYTIYRGSEKILSASSMQMGVCAKTGESLYNAPEKLIKGVNNFVE